MTLFLVDFNIQVLSVVELKGVNLLGDQVESVRL